MDFLSVQPGLLFWSIINFLFFLVVLYFIGGKNFIKNINERESLIQSALSQADEKKETMERLANEHAQKMLEAQNVIDETIKKAKEQSLLQAQQIIDEAKKQKENIINDATAEIERNKKVALQSIKTEVADLVMSATEKIIENKLDKEKDKELIDKYLVALSKN
ncbi:MAG: F0F1 ATP synthase subunit B [Bacteroidetes bacterium]|nr:F0F1 ATP synthase subunit B [Bacteroidota bacterium]